MADPKATKANVEAMAPFADMLKDLRQLATEHIQSLYEFQKNSVEESAKTLSFLLTESVDTIRHMQGIWFSSEEFVTAVARHIFTTTWGKHIDADEAIKTLSSLSPTLYWRPTKELALLMYASSGRSAGDLWEYIDYAKRHVLYQSLAIIDTTNSLSQSIQGLTDFYEKFSARDYFSNLQTEPFVFMRSVAVRGSSITTNSATGFALSGNS